MDLKNAVAVCLISLFSATLVVLIARALDSQAASRLEPQLASIVEELRASAQSRRNRGCAGPSNQGGNGQRRADRLLFPRQHPLSYLPLD